MLADIRLDWTINRWNSFHAGYNTHSERRRLFSQDKSIPAFLPFQPSFHSSDRTQKFSHQNGLFRTMAQPKRLFPMRGTVPQANHRFKLVSLRCSFNAQTTVPRPFLFSRRRLPVTVATVTLRNANFYKSKLVTLNLANSLWRTFPANGSREFK